MFNPRGREGKRKSSPDWSESVRLKKTGKSIGFLNSLTMKSSALEILLLFSAAFHAAVRAQETTLWQQQQVPPTATVVAFSPGSRIFRLIIYFSATSTGTVPCMATASTPVGTERELKHALYPYNKQKIKK